MRAIKQAFVCGRTMAGPDSPFPEDCARIVIPGLNFSSGRAVYTVTDCLEDFDYLQKLVDSSEGGPAPESERSVRKSESDPAPGSEKTDRQIKADRSEPDAVPGVILVLTDRTVYGKVFGTPHALAEEELGYSSHVRAQEESILAMRMLEDLCVRLSGESETPILIGRCAVFEIAGAMHSFGKQEKYLISRHSDDPPVRQLFKVLENGDSGQIYNMEPEGMFAGASDTAAGGTGRNDAQTGNGKQFTTPLSPIPVCLDTGKADALARRQQP